MWLWVVLILSAILGWGILGAFRLGETKEALCGIYGFHLLIIVPWFLGAIFRGEQSPFMWVAYESQLQRFGLGSALFCAYTYVIFYSAFLLLIGFVFKYVRRRFVSHNATLKATAFAIEQQRVRPDAKLEAIFTSRKEADHYFEKGGLADILISNVEEDAFVVFSSVPEEEIAKASGESTSTGQEEQSDNDPGGLKSPKDDPSPPRTERG
jgi:hypothetical protein